MSRKGIIGPYFFPEDTVNSFYYLDMLENFFYPSLQEKGLLSERTHYQQDGAPPHYSLDVRAWLDAKFPQRWIGRAGPIPWPARSPDLTPLDFFLWGYVKVKVYSNRPSNLRELMDRIEDAVKKIDDETLHHVSDCVVDRLHMCIECKGKHFEHLKL